MVPMPLRTTQAWSQCPLRTTQAWYTNNPPNFIPAAYSPLLHRHDEHVAAREHAAEAQQHWDAWEQPKNEVQLPGHELWVPCPRDDLKPTELGGHRAPEGPGEAATMCSSTTGECVCVVGGEKERQATAAMTQWLKHAQG